MAEDTLELALERASHDPRNRPELGLTLLASMVFVIGHVEGEIPVDKEVTFSGGKNVVIRSRRGPDGKMFVPFFSSLEKLQGFIEGQVVYFTIPGRTLLEATRGSTLLLNPGSKISGQFSPKDIEDLLAHSLRN
jgi:hypothetical protein